MKRRVIAVVLSLTMCMSMVVQSSAAALDDDVSGDVSVIEPFEPDVPDVIPQEGTDADITETPSVPEVTETPEEPVIPLEPEEGTENPEGNQEDILTDSQDIVTSGQMEQITPESEMEMAPEIEVAADGSIVVQPQHWVKVPEGFKLVKTAVVSQIPSDPQVEADIETTEEMQVPENAEETVPVTPEPEVQVMEGVGAGEAGISTEAAVENRTFYTAADGIVKVTTTSVKGSHTGYYLFDENGIMVTGRKTVKPGLPGYTADKEGEFYFAEESTAALYSEYAGVAKTPVTSDIGQQKKDYWLYQNGKFRFYEKTGLNVSIELLNEQNKSVGYFHINGKYYCLKDDGTPRTGFIGIYGSKYFFDPDSSIPGQMYMNGWRYMGTNEKGEKWIYFYRENKGADKGKALIHNGNVAITVIPKSRTEKYLLDHNGYILKNRRTRCKDGAWYGSDSHGRILKNRLGRYGNYRYFFTENGKQVGWKNMWKQCPTSVGMKYYYFGSKAGRVSEKKGWQKVKWPSGKYLGWFYFRDNGEHYMGRWVGSQYFESNGRLTSGIKEIDGKTYFFEISSENVHRGRAFRNTMIKYKDRWYYAKSDGQLANNEWRSVNGNWYYFENFVSLQNTFRWKGNTYGWLDQQGKFCTGWVVLSNSGNKVRYVNPKGNGFYKNTSAVIDGLRYYFDDRAYRINDLTSSYRGPYYLEVDRVNGVMTVYNQNGTVPVKTIRVSVGALGTPTPTGRYTVYRSSRWQSLMGPSWGQYGTHVSGAGLGGIFIHSIAGGEMHPYSVPSGEYNKLGNPASHGCIRTCVADAKWIFENCNGARIHIFDGKYESREAMKGPLGRRARVPMRPPYNFDPTDPSI